MPKNPPRPYQFEAASSKVALLERDSRYFDPAAIEADETETVLSNYSSIVGQIAALRSIASFRSSPWQDRVRPVDE
jgi:hypothetical protein